jgi:hypothetical protein
LLTSATLPAGNPGELLLHVGLGGLQLDQILLQLLLQLIQLPSQLCLLLLVILGRKPLSTFQAVLGIRAILVLIRIREYGYGSNSVSDSFFSDAKKLFF